MFSALFVENLMLTGSHVFKQLSLKPFCHGWTVWQADCIVQSKGMESGFMFWLICRSFRAQGIAGRRQQSCVKNMGFYHLPLSGFFGFLKTCSGELVFLPFLPFQFMP